MNVAKTDYPVGLSILLSKIDDSIKRLVKLAGIEEVEADEILSRVEKIADIAAERMNDRRRGR